MNGDVLWTPPADLGASTEIGRFMTWLRDERGRDLADFEALRRWSIEDLEGFWGAIWDFFGVRADTPYERVLGAVRCRARSGSPARGSITPSTSSGARRTSTGSPCSPNHRRVRPSS